MKISSILNDSRIRSQNYLIDLTIEEYLSFAKDIIKQNEFQRKRVKSSKTIYSLLRSDILDGCIMPPIVLAVTKAAPEEESDDIVSVFVLENKEDMVILDGLQRTHTLIDVENDLKAKKDEDGLRKFYGHKIRVEIYFGINRIGILYRMLTLNTGQTPMSLRQQIEILYLDYMKKPLGNVELVRETDSRIARGLHQYNFKDIVEGFNSYLDRNELPISRDDILENIKSLEKLAKENSEVDIFSQYVEAWDGFVTAVHRLVPESASADVFEDKKLFGQTALQVFKKPQAMTGFGAAIGKLRDYAKITGFDDVARVVPNLEVGSAEGQDVIDQINSHLLWINQNSTKIGNVQRNYFQYYFRELFNPETDSHLKIYDSIDPAFKKMQSQLF